MSISGSTIKDNQARSSTIKDMVAAFTFIQNLRAHGLQQNVIDRNWYCIQWHLCIWNGLHFTSNVLSHPPAIINEQQDTGWFKMVYKRIFYARFDGDDRYGGLSKCWAGVWARPHEHCECLWVAFQLNVLGVWFASGVSSVYQTVGASFTWHLYGDEAWQRCCVAEMTLFSMLKLWTRSQFLSNSCTVSANPLPTAQLLVPPGATSSCTSSLSFRCMV